MKKFSLVIMSVLFITISCETEERSSTPKQINATDGFAVGCIRLDFEKDPEVQSVRVERREKGASEWQHITSTALTSFDDIHGYENEMPQGKIFEYRIRNDWPEDSEYSEIEEGYAYEIIPVTDIEIESSVQYDERTINILSWNEENNGTFINDAEIYFDIYRSGDSLGTYTKIGQVGEDRGYTDELPAELKGVKVYYRVDVYFSYMLYMPSGGNNYGSTAPVEGTVVGMPTDAGGNATVDYTITELGQVTSSAQGGITQLAGKNVNGTPYLGIINDAGATGYGEPQLFSFNGNTWQKQWTEQPVNAFDEINYAIGASSHYLAGIQDSLCVYEWNGSSWSKNMAPGNLGQADAPSQVEIEYYNNEVYMAITQYPEYDLQVLKYNGSTWDTIGGGTGSIASGNIYDVTLKNINNQLYLYFRIDNTLNIRHLNGGDWVVDLSWSKDNIANVEIASGSDGLYFIAGSSNSIYRGGVYKVTSATVAEEIISNATDDWFQFPLGFAIDSNGHLVVSSMKFESADVFYPFINVFDGTDWKTITGDFSDGMDPVSIIATGTDIIYTCGDATSENTIGDPTVITSKKLSK